MSLRRERGAAEQLEPVQRGAAIAVAELVEHVLDERGLEHRVCRADADAGVGESELDFAAVDGIEHARDVALLDKLADGNRHRGRRDAQVVGEIAQHHGPFGVEVVHDADLPRAHADAAFWIADVAAVAGEIDAGVIAEDAGDVIGEAHGSQDRTGS